MFYFHGNVTMLLVAYRSANFQGVHSLPTVTQYFTLARVSTELHHLPHLNYKNSPPQCFSRQSRTSHWTWARSCSDCSNNELLEIPVEIHGSFILSIQLATELTWSFLTVFPKEGNKTLEHWCPQNALSRHCLHTEVHRSHFLRDATVSSKNHNGFAIGFEMWLLASKIIIPTRQNSRQPENPNSQSYEWQNTLIKTVAERFQNTIPKPEHCNKIQESSVRPTCCNKLTGKDSSLAFHKCYFLIFEKSNFTDLLKNKNFQWKKIGISNMCDH